MLHFGVVQKSAQKSADKQRDSREDKERQAPFLAIGSNGVCWVMVVIGGSPMSGAKAPPTAARRGAFQRPFRVRS
jgi:hypothetical protein